MKLHLSNEGQTNVITGYGEGYVQVNTTRIAESLLVGNGMFSPWPVANIRDLTAENLSAIVAAAPEILILGTGRTFQFPSPALLRPLIEARIGHEVMDTAAACRTYNVLLGEGRKVMAALVVD
jgi:uncharacterized protein